jgi:hypothetical protein
MIILYIIIIVVVVNPVETVEKAERVLYDFIPAVEKKWKNYQFIHRIPVNIPCPKRKILLLDRSGYRCL